MLTIDHNRYVVRAMRLVSNKQNVGMIPNVMAETWWTEGPHPHAKFHPHRCNDTGIGPPKLKKLLKFDQTSEYKRKTGAYPLRDFDEISRFRTSFQKVLAVKILIDFLNGLRSYGGFKLRGSGSPKFSAPRSGETMRRTPESFRDGRTCSRSSITMPSLVWLHIRPPPKTFFCLSIRHAVERQSLCARFRHEGVGVLKRF